MSYNEQPRVLISRLSAVGDCVLTMPLASAIKQKYPNAFVAWVTQPLGATLLEGHECIDKLIVAPKGFMKSPSDTLGLRRQLRSYRFDVAIDAQSLTKSSVPCWLSGAKQRIGFASPQGRELALWTNNTRLPRTSDHIVDAQLDLLKPLGIQNIDVRFKFPYNHDAGRMADTFIEDANLAEGFAVINPGAGWDSKLWPAARFGNVARHLGDRWSLPTVVVWAGMKEHHFAESIVEGSGGHAVMAPETSLTELTALTRRAHMFFSSDTGPIHIAAAVGIPCVGLYGTTHSKHCGPYGTQHIVLQGPYREMSSREQRSTTNDAMRAITTEQACDACDELLDRLTMQSFRAAS